MAFKEILSSKPLPAVLVHSLPTSPASFSRSWQFSTLHPMLGGKFVVTIQENTLFVLDSRSGAVVGVAVFKDPIKSISTSGGFLYILSNVTCKATTVIVRVAVHYSYVTTESEPWKLQLTTPTSVNNSPLGSLESLVKDVGTLQVRDLVEASPASEHSDLVAMDQTLSAATSESAMSHIGPQELIEQVDDSVQVFVIPCSEDLKTMDVDKSVPVTHTIGSSEEDASVDNESKVEGDTTFAKTLLSVPQKSPPTLGITEDQEERDSTEQSRRLHMSQAAEDDLVADSKSHDSKTQRKRRKKVKGKKLSSAASKFFTFFGGG